MKKTYTSSKKTWDKNSNNFERLIKRSFRNYVGTLLLTGVGMSAAYAQTNPTPQPVPYTQNFDNLTNAFPEGWQGWRLNGNINEEYLTSAPSAEQVFYTSNPTLSNAVSSAHIGNIGQRLGFLNTNANRTVPVLAVSTLDRQQIKIKYDINLQRVNSNRVLGVQLQYRIGTEGDFTPVVETTKTFTGGGTGTNTSGTNFTESETVEYSLPANVAFQPNVQFRWVTARSQGGSGDNLGFSIDNIEVTGITDPCANNPIPYSEDFTGLTDVIRECTSVQNVNNDDQTWSVYTTTQTGFTAPLLRYRWNTSNDANDWFYTKGLSLEAGVNYRLKYKYGTSTSFDEKLKVAIGSSASNEAMTQIIFDHGTFRQGTAATKEVFFTVPTSGNYYVGFHAYSAKNMFSIYLDDIVVDLAPTCIPPTAVTTSNITHNTAEVSWTASISQPGGYEYYVSTSTTAPEATTTPTGTSTTTSASLSNLSPLTAYNVWVRSACSADEKSEWTAITTFQTGQLAATFPYVDNFDTAQWVLANGTQTNKFYVGTPTTANSVTYADNKLFISNNGTSSGYANTTSHTYAYRDIAIPADINLAKIAFKWIARGESTSWDFGRFYLTTTDNTPIAGTEIDRTAAIAPNSFFNATIDSSVRSGSEPFALYSNKAYSGAFETVAHQFYKEDLDLSNFAGQTIRAVFYWRNDGLSSNPPALVVDDFEFTYAPSCLSLSQIAVNSFTSNSATISWSGNSDSYSYVVSTENIAPTGNTGTVTTESTVNLTDLSEFTTYYWWVKADCDSENNWIAGPSFTTNAPTQVYPFTDNFDTLKWSLANGNQFNKFYVGTPTGLDGGKLYISENGNTNSYNVDSESKVFAYTDVELPSDITSAKVKFTWNAVGESTYDYGRFFIVPTSYQPTAGTEITSTGSITGQYFGSTKLNLSSGTLVFDETVDLSAVAGQTVRLVFYWKNDGSLGTQPPLSIDNFCFANDCTDLAVGNVNKGNFEYYPNPVQNELNFKGDQTIVNIEVYNLAGQTVNKVKVGGKTHQLNTSKLSAGVYMVKVSFENGTSKTVKIIKK